MVLATAATSFRNSRYRRKGWRTAAQMCQNPPVRLVYRRLQFTAAQKAWRSNLLRWTAAGQNPRSLWQPRWRESNLSLLTVLQSPEEYRPASFVWKRRLLTVCPSNWAEREVRFSSACSNSLLFTTSPSKVWLTLLSFQLQVRASPAWSPAPRQAW